MVSESTKYILQLARKQLPSNNPDALFEGCLRFLLGMDAISLRSYRTYANKGALQADRFLPYREEIIQQSLMVVNVLLREILTFADNGSVLKTLDNLHKALTYLVLLKGSKLIPCRRVRLSLSRLCCRCNSTAI